MSPLAKTLFEIQKKPAMWLGCGVVSARSISLLSAFIAGYQTGKNADSDSLHFENFTQWVAAHYRVNDGAMSGFTLIMEKVGGDESRAFDEFFRLLPLFVADMEQIGPESVVARYKEVMHEIRQRG
jgi:hypothetical protein